MEQEIWKSILGYEGLYEVSNFGRIKSLPRSWVAGKGFKMSHAGKILSLSKDKDGYKVVGLHKNKVGKNYKVHRLVVCSFRGLSDKFLIDHKDGDKSNNNLDNLRECTHRENQSFDNCKRRRSSKYRGESWHIRKNKWCAMIGINGKQKHLGTFLLEEHASDAYQKALKELI